MLFRVLALIKKEFLAILKDPKGRFIIIGPPIIQLLVYGYAATFDLNHVRFSVYNEDQGPASRAVIEHFKGSPVFEETREITRLDQIPGAIDSQETLLVLHIGPRFSEELLRGGSTAVQVIIDGRNSNTALIALNYARSIITRFTTDWIRDHGGPSPPVRIETRAWFNPNLESRWFIIPGVVGILTLVVTLLVTALSVAREREQGTFDQLLVTPLRPIDILVAKSAPAFIIGFIEATFIIAVAVLWFDVPLRGDIVTLYIGLAVFLLSSVGVGLMISSLSVTQQQGLLGAFLFLVPAIILSGFATPIANMPPFVQYLTYLNPLRYFMIILRETFLQGSPWTVLLHQFWPMAAIGVSSLAAAGFLFRRRMY